MRILGGAIVLVVVVVWIIVGMMGWVHEGPRWFVRRLRRVRI